jgi:hypothetical protein
MRFLYDLLMACHLVNHTSLFILVLDRSIRLTLQHGMTEYSPFFITYSAVLLGVVKGDFQGGAQQVEVAQRAMKKFHSKAIEARALAVFPHIVSWAKPIQGLTKVVMLRIYKLGMESGDTDTACFGIYWTLLIGLISGKKLDGIEADCQIYLPQMDELERSAISMFTRALCQAIHNLMGLSQHSITMRGDMYDPDVHNKDMHGRTWKPDTLVYYLCA